MSTPGTQIVPTVQTRVATMQENPIVGWYYPFMFCPQTEVCLEAGSSVKTTFLALVDETRRGSD